MIDIPEPEKEAQPILHDPERPNIDDKPVSVPEIDISSASNSEEKRSSLLWIGVKHFLYGFVLSGAASLASGALPLVALGIAITGGVAEAGRKIVKEKAAAKGSDWADVLDKLLQLLILLVKSWLEKKKKK